MKLFTVESQSAGEGLTQPGPWQSVGEADTLEEAETLAATNYAKGWRYARVVANLEQTDALRIENAKLRVDLDFFRKLAGAPADDRSEANG